MADKKLGKEMIRKSILLSGLWLSLMFFSQPVFGTTGGGINVGLLTTGAGDTVGSRELVELQGKNGILYGFPENKSIELITIYAPGCTDGHVILRVLDLKNGKVSLLLSAPDSIKRKVFRATIYLKHFTKDLILLENIDDSWEYREPHVISTKSNENSNLSKDVLLAFTVNGLGSFWIQNGHFSEHPPFSNIPQHHSPSSLFGGGLSSAIGPWGWAIFLLCIGWAFSRWMHRIEKQEAN